MRWKPMLEMKRMLANVAALSPDDVNVVDEGGRSLLAHAVLAEGDDTMITETLLALGADPNYAEPPDDWTPLHFAARDQKIARVRALLAGGAALDPVDENSITPLMRSVTSTQEGLEVARALIEHGADPHIAGSSGLSPISIARQSNNDELLAILTSRS